MHQADLSHSDQSLQKKLEYIFQLRRTKTKINWDADLYHKLLDSFGNPQDHLPPVIHVAGTNGKGSTIAMLRSILEESGRRVHVYTSPHLIDVNERIYLAGENIENAALESLIDQALSFINDAPLSFFEIITAVAFKAFSETPADVLLLEVGMGGRLDCTNVIKKPIATIINRISMDHTEFLGNTIAQITREKAGIIKESVPCIVGYQGDHADTVIDVIKEEALEHNAPLLVCDEDWSVVSHSKTFEYKQGDLSTSYPKPALKGDHQVLNAGLALAALKSIENDIEISEQHIKNGLSNVFWPGRLQSVPTNIFNVGDETKIWLDCGHNDSASEALVSHINQLKLESLGAVHLVVGMLGQKDSKRFLEPLLNVVDSLNIVPITSDPTTKSADEMLSSLNVPDKIQVSAFSSVVEAINALGEGKATKHILVAGSVYLAGELLGHIQASE